MNSISHLLFRLSKTVFLSATALFFASCGGNSGEEGIGTSSDGLSLKQLVIALKANKNPEHMLAEKEELEKYLGEKLKRQVKVIIPTSSAVVVESFKNKTLDIGYLSSTDAARNLDEAAASILLIHLKNGQPHYNSIWLSLKDKEYDSVDDLAGKPVAFASSSSTSGYLIPTWDLSKRGHVGPEKALTDYFSQTIYGTGYVSAAWISRIFWCSQPGCFVPIPTCADIWGSATGICMTSGVQKSLRRRRPRRLAARRAAPHLRRRLRLPGQRLPHSGGGSANQDIPDRTAKCFHPHLARGNRSLSVAMSFYHCRWVPAEPNVRQTA